MRTRFFAGTAVLVAAWGLIEPVPLDAHATRAVSVEIGELSEGQALLHVRKQLPQDVVDVSIDAPCRAEALEDSTVQDPLQHTTRVHCPKSVAGATLRFAGLGPIVTEAIVVYAFADGRSGSSVVRASDGVFVLPAATSRASVAGGYVASGIAHILAGYDHLLFLLLLALNLRTLTSVLVAETAFTLSHSLSFSATALGWIHVSSVAAEACIALSLVLMAFEIRVGEPGDRRRGALMAFAFGLVHGLGFAGALTEVGVPGSHVAAALLGFAGGVEVGQVLFLACVMAVFYGLARMPRLPMRKLEAAAVAVFGGVSTYWFIERVVTVLAA